MRRLGIATVALIVSLATAAPSLAARAEMSIGGNKYRTWMVLWVTAAAGERNDLVITQTGDLTRITDSIPVTPGDFCEAQPDGSVLCQGTAYRPLADVRIDSGDLDDSARAELDSDASTRLSGGTGNDVLTMVASSVYARTQFDGGPGDDVMTGGLGVDRFVEGSVASGSDVMLGGSEWDVPLSFSRHRDEVSYEDRSNPIRADVQGDRDDGERSEGDTIGSDVESIAGGAGADVLGGNAGPNRLDGGAGADLLTGGDGDDYIRGGGFGDKSTDRLVGGAGRDFVYGGGGSDSLYGGPGWDELHGGSGRDTIRPGGGYDRIFGGPGNDMFWARDGRIESVQCGGGWDRVLPDPLEQLETDCERDLTRPRRARR
jgi:hypothetical protein